MDLLLPEQDRPGASTSQPPRGPSLEGSSQPRPPSTTRVGSEYSTSNSRQRSIERSASLERGGFPAWSYITPSPGRHLPAVTPMVVEATCTHLYTHIYVHACPQ